jgi:hypothetical protein
VGLATMAAGVVELASSGAGVGEGLRRPFTYSSSKKPVLVPCKGGGNGSCCADDDGKRTGAATRGTLVVSAGVASEAIMRPCAKMVGEDVGPTPARPHCSFPRTSLDPPGGLLGEVAFRMSSVKLAFWLAMTLHWAESWEF